MGLLNSGLQAVFGAAFAAIYADGVLHKTSDADDGAGGFSVGSTDYPVKVLLDSLSDQDRVAAGLPRTAVRLSALAAGLPVAIDVDDSVTLGSATYRIVQVQSDGLGVSFTLSGVPA